MALGQLVNGVWQPQWTEQDASGQFRRMATHFHHWIQPNSPQGFLPEAGRYHLYISLGCPWAHRTAILWKLKGLESIVGLSIVDPVISDYGWRFSDYPGTRPDTIYQSDYLWQLYVKSDPGYSGRVTVPVLWDTQTHRIVNNESRQIIQMLNHGFDHLGANPVDFYPEAARPEIDRVLDVIYQPINNGVYRSGFARSQAAYESAVTELFAALENWETVLGQQRYLCGGQITLADWCLFTTLFRFDLAYHGLFKCNLKRLIDFPQLWNYCRELYQYPGVSAVCSIDHVKRLYYAGLPELNPSGVIPLGPTINFSQPHTRHTMDGI
ncbi:MAG: glutathione S-transferase family protein [Synechococcales cyanobacterium]